MAKGKKTGGRNFVKGDPRIQGGGAPALPAEIKEIRALSKEEFIIRFEKYCFKTVDDLKALQRDGTLEALDAVFIRALLRSISTGDYRFIQECVDRIIGRPRQVFEHSGRDGAPIKTVNFPVDMSKFSVDQLLKLANGQDAAGT